MIDDIYSRSPANGTAGSVVGQAGCVDELNGNQKMDNLRARMASLQETLDRTPKGKFHAPERKRLGVEINQLGLEINQLKKHDAKADLTHYILDVAKENVTQFQWKKIIEEARLRHGEANGY